jgi:hypothetical protein
VDKNFSGSACGISHNQPATCSKRKNKKEVAPKVGWKMVSKGNATFFY